MAEPKARVALLIDGENISPATAAKVFAHARSLGDLVVQRVYGHVLKVKGWSEVHELDAVYVELGKNGADLALSLDALELAMGDRAEHFVIVSSDRDLAQVARRLRHLGKLVTGMGVTPPGAPFPNACDWFLQMSPRRAPLAPQPILPVVAAGLLRLSAAKADAEGWIDSSVFGAKDLREFGLTKKPLGGGKTARSWPVFLARYPDLVEIRMEGSRQFFRLTAKAFADFAEVGTKAGVGPVAGFEDRMANFIAKQSVKHGWYPLKRLGGKRARRAKVTKADGGIKASLTWRAWLRERPERFELSSDNSSVRVKT